MRPCGHFPRRAGKDKDMTIQDLSTFFKSHLVPARLYKIGGKHNNRICLSKTEDGWEVYFSDHKDKVGLMQFQDEDSACRSMMDEIRKIMEVAYGMTWVPERA